MISYAVIGGAGFIGSHFVDELISLGHQVKVIDNLCSGTISRIEQHKNIKNFEFVNVAVENTALLAHNLRGIDVVIHLASNPDIARAATDPRIDFTQGTVLTESVLEASRVSRVSKILYASGSGVYGDVGREVSNEDSAIKPISTYGASKAAGEHLLRAYSNMFGIKTLAFRFANVVGSRQTHGVGFDFLYRLEKNPNSLHILGNGEQSKSYVHVSDVVKGVLLASEKVASDFEAFNISTLDYIDVNEIALIVMEQLNIDPRGVELTYSGGVRGWKADVPVVRLDAQKIIDLGWMPKFNSYEAMHKSIREMIITRFH